jgi:hypothetical protein
VSVSLFFPPLARFVCQATRISLGLRFDTGLTREFEWRQIREPRSTVPLQTPHSNIDARSQEQRVPSASHPLMDNQNPNNRPSTRAGVTPSRAFTSRTILNCEPRLTSPDNSPPPSPIVTSAQYRRGDQRYGFRPDGLKIPHPSLSRHKRDRESDSCLGKSSDLVFKIVLDTWERAVVSALLRSA